MSIAFDEIVSSPIFYVLLGKQQKRMSIHRALLAIQSPALESLVGGSMEEAQSRTVIWEDVEEDTFARFAQFVYTTDYTPPSFTIDLKVVQIPEATEIHGEEDAKPTDQYWGSKKKKKSYVSSSWGGDDGQPDDAVVQLVDESVTSPRISSRPRFRNLAYPLSSHLINTGVRPNESAAEDYLSVFLGHARLYVLAEKYDIGPLRSLALHKLHATLCCFKMYEARYGDIIELARYVYKNTPTRVKIDPLREMIIHYIAYEVERVAGCSACLELVTENGDFACDLLKMVLERVRAS